MHNFVDIMVQHYFGLAAQQPLNSSRNGIPRLKRTDWVQIFVKYVYLRSRFCLTCNIKISE